MTKTIRPLWSHQKRVVEKVINERRNYFALFHDMGCLAGDTIIKVNRGGKDFKCTIKELYEKINRGYFTASIPTRIRSYKEDLGYIGLHELERVVYSGKKELFIVFFNNGETIKATKDHKFLTNEGFLPLEKLTLSHIVMVDNLIKHKSKTIKSKIKKPRGKEVKRLKYIDTSAYHIHHKDSKEEHLKEHGNYIHFGHGTPEYSKVIAIKHVGIEDTYDIICKEPYRNFVANNIVVHNSGKTRTAIDIYRGYCTLEKRLLKCLIITPLATIHNWKREIIANSHIDEKKISVVDGKKKGRKSATKEQKIAQLSEAFGIYIINTDLVDNATLWPIIEKLGIEFLVVDECFSKDTEILTEKGFIRFDELKNELVAQIDKDTHKLDFVEPERKIKKIAKELIEIDTPQTSLRVTPNHDLLLGKTIKKDFKKIGVLWEKERAIDFYNSPKTRKVLRAGISVAESDTLTPIEKFLIALQADGSIHNISKRCKKNSYLFSFSKERKIIAFEKLLSELGAEFTVVKSSKKIGNKKSQKRYIVYLDKQYTKEVYNYFDLTKISFKKARNILDYCMIWDGHITNKGGLYYSSTNEKCVDFYQAVATLAYYRAVKKIQVDNRKDTFNNVYRLFINKLPFSSTQTWKPKKVAYNDYAYCVTVPKGNIVVRHKGTVTVVGNCHNFKNPEAKRTKALMKFSRAVKRKFILTGSPVLQSALDLWSQFYILNPDILGANFFSFRAQYFYDANAGMPANVHFPNWKVKDERYFNKLKRQGVSEAEIAKQSLNNLNETIYKYADRVMKKDVLDLPPITYQTLEVELSKEQARIYNEMKEHLVAQLEESEDDLLEVMDELPEIMQADLAIVKILRLMQICAGVVKADGKEAEMLPKVPRLELLKDTLEEILANAENKVIIWTTFKPTYKAIAKICEELKVKYVLITGETKDKQASMDAFNNDDSVRVVIANQSAGGTGITLNAANYSIYYSRSFNLAHDLQSEARNYRGGQTRNVTRIDLVASETIDAEIVKALADKKAHAEDILNTKNKQFTKDELYKMAGL